MSSPTYWPFAPLTPDLIDTTIKNYEGLGPTSKEYHHYLQGLEPMVGKGIEALYLMGRTIIPEEVGPDGDMEFFLKVAETGDAKSYVRYLKTQQFPEMVKRAVGFLKGEQDSLKTPYHLATTVSNTESMADHASLAATQRKLRENLRETARKYGTSSEEYQRALYDAPLDPNFDEIDEG